MNRPSILLADEPTGNLDSRTSVEIMQVFQELNASEKLTIILVTHESDIAEYTKRVITFRDGRIIKDEAVQNRRIAGGSPGEHAPDGGLTDSGRWRMSDPSSQLRHRIEG